MSGAARAKREMLGGGGIVALLSLNLILLAFFILLNSLSELEAARTRVVLDSVNKTFQGRLEPIKAPALLDGSPGLLDEAEALAHELGSLFESIVPAPGSTRTEPNHAVHIELPSSALFKVGENTLRPERKALVRRVAKALLRRNAQDRVYELMFLHGVPAGGAAGAQRAQEVLRAADLVSFLASEGLTPDLLSIGVLPGRAGKIEFVLKLREAPPATDEPPQALPAVSP